MTAKKDPGPTLERLSAMLDALQSSENLSREMRAEIARILHAMWLKRLASRRGRPLDDDQRYAAFRVWYLHTHHGALIKAAAAAVAGPRATLSDVDALQSQYRAMVRAGELPGDYLPIPPVLEADLNRLGRHAKRHNKRS